MIDLDETSLTTSQLEGRAMDYLGSLPQAERTRFAHFLRMYADIGGGDSRSLRYLATRVEEAL